MVSDNKRMKTLYAACLSRLGLSQSEAAALHGVRIDTVKSWSSGRNPVPPGAWEDLRARESQIVDGSEAMHEAWDTAGGPPIEINADDADKASMMAAADFVLNATAPVHADAARMGRQKLEQTCHMGTGHMQKNT